jgi:ABC-type phosphate transport system ATPase subunit
MSTSKGTEKNAFYLTETILSIHNEVQSALDYISSVAAVEGTDLGKSTALLSIENLRVKVPIKFSIETGQKKLAAPATKDLSPNEIRAALPKRVGFVIERDLPKNYSVFSKVRVALKPQDIPTAKTGAEAAGEAAETSEAWGEIEITFAPIKRQ